MIKRQLFQLINWREIKPYLVFSLIWLIFSYPFFFRGRIPAPLDFLVDFYSPWEQYYNLPVKNSSLSDVVSQIIPWKLFNAQELKAGRIPIWNSYNLGGTPQLGNWQSGVFYPTTLLFLVLPETMAWSFHILLQPLLAGLFMLLFLRSLSLSPISSLLGAIVFSYGGFMTSWFEWGTLGHAILWLPLALYGIDRVKSKEQRVKSNETNVKISLLTIIAITMSLLAGHPQTSIYLMITIIGYFLYRNWSLNKFRLLLFTNYYLLIPIFLAAPQVFPSIQVYMESAKNLIDGSGWARAFLIKPENLLTFFSPDFFGNPVTRNNWGSFSYVEMGGYIGIASLFLAITGMFMTFRKTKFYILLIFAALIFSVDSPVSRLLIELRIPVISSSSPSRLIGIVDFGLAVLAAFGLNYISEISKKKQIKLLVKIIIAITLVFSGMWIWTYISNNPNVPVTRRNLIFPSIIFSAAIAIIVNLFFSPKRVRSLLIIFYSLLSILDLFRFYLKFNPFALSQYWYPDVPVLSELRKRTGRVFGGFEGNMNIQYQIKTIEGYDPLINKEIVRMTYTPEELSKKNRIVSPDFPKGDPATIELLNKMGVKWIVDYSVPGNGPWDLRLWNYGDQFRIDWKDASYQILYNTKAVAEEFEPIIKMKDSQYFLFKLGLAVSAVACFGILFGYKKYVK
ncbi:hypothetical protein HZB78_05325 [Candidatus Collierbacteria bacterium]|nr:hypothetical protein [Candidatus Collierbacteria bacterium]